MKSANGPRFWLVAIGFLVTYVAFDFAARMFTVGPEVSLWYPPVGLTLAFATIYGWRSAPPILAAFLYSFFITSDVPFSWLGLSLPIVLATNYFLAGCLVRRRFGPLPMPAGPANTALLIAITITAPVTAAVAATGIYYLSGRAPTAGLPRIAVDWLIGDLTGILTIVPLCFVHFAPRLVRGVAPPRREWTRRELGELVGQGLTLLACTTLSYGFSTVRDYQAHYLCFVPLVWICLRHGLPGATIATCVLTMGNLLAVRVIGASQHAVIDLLLFEIAITSVGLGLGLVVTRRTHVERERVRLLAILEATPDFVGTADLEGHVLYRNAAFLEFCGQTGPAAASQAHIGDRHTPESAARILQEALPAALAHGAWSGEVTFVDRSGREVPFLQTVFVHRDAAGHPVLYSTVAREIGALKQAERARLEAERSLFQSQKLESLGVLAGGIAHDFNNLLTTMLGNATLARLDTPADSDAERAIHQIELAALRAGELCRQMLAYAGKGRLAAELVDLNELVQDTTHLLRASISKKAGLSFDLRKPLPKVRGDAAQLSQIVMNLVVNASDAIGDRPGHIAVHTGIVKADTDYLAGAYLAPALPPGDYVFLEVKDDGCGMDPDVQARIFEPFFTTKFSGHGLGLSAVLGIARTHQGTLKVESARGQGSTFRLLLPAATAPAPAAPPGATGSRSPLITWHTTGRLLIADDEESVRSVSALILERCGFQVDTAVDGREAVDLFRQRPAEYRAVLLDLTMPVMDGAEAYREIRALNPGVPIVLMSGYSAHHSAQRIGDGRAAGFIQKPFQTAQLVAAMRAALEPGATPAGSVPS